MTEQDSILLSLNPEESQTAWRLAHGLDLRLEECQRKGLSAKKTFAETAPWITEQIGASGLGISLHGSGGERMCLYFGEDRSLLESHFDGKEVEGVTAVELVLHDEPIGILAASFDKEPRSPGPQVLLDVAGQELDNVLYEYRRARFRHKQITEMERRLQQNVLDTSVDSAAEYVIQETGIHGLVLIYGEDEGKENRVHKRIRVYGKGGLERCILSGCNDPLGNLVEDDTYPSTNTILSAAGFSADHTCRAAIETGLNATNSHGVLVATGTERSVTGAEHELLSHFALTLGQRLVDYHKDRRFLQQFFGPTTVSELLTHRNYHEEFLSPRLREVAFLYTDITSFTKISEQILDSPREVGELIDYWSAGVVEILFSHGGAFDKMVGDCVIGLFGTPFDQMSPVQCVEGAVRAALEIEHYTAELTGIDEVEKIRCSDLIPGLGVATGVSFGKAMVGTFGPNNDFTAFGRAMNNTARLQGVAGFREVLLMDSAMEVLSTTESRLLQEIDVSHEKEAAVKNVALPLKYRVVKTRR